MLGREEATVERLDASGRVVSDVATESAAAPSAPTAATPVTPAAAPPDTSYPLLRKHKGLLE
jgi:hypothetical protein